MVFTNMLFGLSSSLSADTEIFIAIDGFINPSSVQDLGDFVITSYKMVDEELKEVDSTTIESPLSTTAGTTYKIAEIEASSYITNEEDVTYTFYVSFEHPVPEDGYVRVELPYPMVITDTETVQTSCFQVSITTISLDCYAYEDYIDVYYGEIIYEQIEFTLQIGGLKNPR